MSDRFPLQYFAVEQFIFARLDDEEAAGSDPERIARLRELAAEHSIWVDRERVSHWRCMTCDPTEGAPCLTARNLAHFWYPHPEFPEWALNREGGTDIYGDAARAGGWFALRYPETPVYEVQP